MSNDQTKALSPYWRRITGKAGELLLEKIERLEKQTVDPALCLLPEDAQTMAMRRLDIEGYREILDKVRQGGLAGKLWALDTVWGHSPCMVLGR